MGAFIPAIASAIGSAARAGSAAKGRQQKGGGVTGPASKSATGQPISSSVAPGGKPLDLQSGPAAVNAASQAQHQKQYPTFRGAFSGNLAAGQKPGTALIGALARPKPPKIAPGGGGSAF